MTIADHVQENRRLVALSHRAASADPIDWPARLDPNRYCFSPELISLAGTDAFARMDAAERRRLSLHEAANFFSLNIHNEKRLVAGLASFFDRPEFAAHREFLEHFREEEVRHTAMFTDFCRRYVGGPYPERQMPFGSDDGPDADLLFFARVAIFEEIVDAYNRKMAQDARLDPVVRTINHVHHLDEARHLSFGHRLLRDLVAMRASAWTPEERARVCRRLAKFMDQTWAALFDPVVYRDAGLEDAFALRRQAMASPAAQRRRDWALRGCRRLLSRFDLHEGDRS